MRNNLFKKYLVFGIIVLLFGLTVGPTVNAIKTGNERAVNTTADNNYIILTVSIVHNDQKVYYYQDRTSGALIQSAVS